MGRNFVSYDPKTGIATEFIPHLVDVALAADVLTVQPRKVRELCQSGRLKAVKVGDEWRVNRDELFEYAGLIGAVA